MPIISVNGVELFYSEHGDASKPTIAFTHSLLWDSEMFDDVVSALSADYRIINIDQHGHGRSGFRPSFTLEEMAEDYAALLDLLGLDAVHWAGLSMGGMVGMRLALAHPQKVRSLILMDTSAMPEREDQRDTYDQLAEGLRAGLAPTLVDAILPFFFAPCTFEEQPELVSKYAAKLQTYGKVEGIYQASKAVFNRSDISDRLKEIEKPALVIVGEDDFATLPEQSEIIASRLPNARLEKIPKAGHMSATEKPAAVVEAIKDFLLTSSRTT